MARKAAKKPSSPTPEPAMRRESAAFPEAEAEALELDDEPDDELDLVPVADDSDERVTVPVEVVLAPVLVVRTPLAVVVEPDEAVVVAVAAVPEE